MKKHKINVANKLCNTKHLVAPLVRVFGILAIANTLSLAFLIMYPSFLTIRIIYNFNTIFIPIVLIPLSAFLYVSSRGIHRETGRHHSAIAMGIIGITLVTARIYCTHIEPSCLRIRHVTLPCANLTKPLTLLHCTDIQSAEIGKYEKRAFEKIMEINPDIIIHTGDMLQPQPPATMKSELPKLATLFESLHPPLGIYGVYGDVDGEIRRMKLPNIGGMILLDNESFTINTGHAQINILGLTSHKRGNTESEDKSLITDWLKKTREDEITVLIGHSPDFVLLLDDKKIDLCLAGHTHGGQIRVPFFGAILTLSKIPRAMARGFHKYENTCLNVSAGIGSEHAYGVPPIRFNCPPEMTLIKLVPESEGNTL